MAVPKLRFKGFISDWDSIHILDIAHTYIGLVTTMTENYVEKGTLLIRNSDIKENCFSFEKKIFLDEEFANNNANRKHCEGDVITVHTGDIGTSAVIDKSMEGSIGFATIVTRVKDKSRYNSKYISWYYNSPIYKKYALRMSTGDGRNNLNMKDFNKAYIPVPCFEEQNKIADFLTTFDKRITVQQNIVADLEETKKGLLQKIFSREIRFKDANGQDYPDWKESTIGNEGYFYYGKSAPKWSITDDAQTPCIRYGELYTTHYYEVKEIKSYTNIERKNLRFSKGNEVLVPRVGEDPLDFHRCAYLPFKDVAIGEMISVYNTENNPLFISYCFNATMKYKFARVVEGGNVSNLYYSYLENIGIGIPCREEQDKIAEYFSTFDKKITAEKQILSDLQEMKKGLLQQMFV